MFVSLLWQNWQFWVPFFLMWQNLLIWAPVCFCYDRIYRSKSLFFVVVFCGRIYRSESLFFSSFFVWQNLQVWVPCLYFVVAEFTDLSPCLFFVVAKFTDLFLCCGKIYRSESRSEYVCFFVVAEYTTLIQATLQPLLPQAYGRSMMRSRSRSTGKEVITSRRERSWRSHSTTMENKWVLFSHGSFIRLLFKSKLSPCSGMIAWTCGNCRCLNVGVNGHLNMNVFACDWMSDWSVEWIWLSCTGHMQHGLGGWVILMWPVCILLCGGPAPKSFQRGSHMWSNCPQAYKASSSVLKDIVKLT